VWARKAVIPDAATWRDPRRPAQLFDLSPTNLQVTFPTPHRVADVLDQEVFDRQIDPTYYPADLYRKPEPNSPKASDRRPEVALPAAPHEGEACGQGDRADAVVDTNRRTSSAWRDPTDRVDGFLGAGKTAC
jgi:hypothetical protein